MDMMNRIQTRFREIVEETNVADKMIRQFDFDYLFTNFISSFSSSCLIRPIESERYSKHFKKFKSSANASELFNLHVPYLC